MIRACKNGKKKYQSLGISVRATDWDFKKNVSKPKYPNRELINKIIVDKQSEFREQIVKLKSEHKEFTAKTLIEKKPTWRFKQPYQLYW